MEGEQDFHSSHCDKCWNLVQCNKMRKGRSREEFPCLIVLCRFKCGHKMHECKVLEHELLCPRMRVACINKEFGCPLMMERRRRGVHLETCPASVIVCTMEWNRWPLPPGKDRTFPMNPAQLDVASTLRDEKMLSEWKEFVPPTLRYLLRTHMNDKHPVIPLGVSGLRIPKSILNQAIIEQNLKLETDNSESSDSEPDESSSDSPWGWKKCPPGLQESVCTKLKALNVCQQHNNGNGTQLTKSAVDVVPNGCVPRLKPVVIEETNHKSSNNSNDEGAMNNKGEGEHNGAANNKKKNVELSLMVEVRTRCQRKPDAMYTFMCSREFRRDEYPNHFRSVHSEIHTQLNGWLFTRCPLAPWGCEFGLEKIHPVDYGYSIVYHDVGDTFCFSQKVMDHHNNRESTESGGGRNFVSSVTQETPKTDDNPTVSLSSLPFELLVHLTNYLDPLSLHSLSMTSKLLRDACSCVVVDRGIVVLQWEKRHNELGWEAKEKKWIFSSAFSPIRKWKFGDVGRMITHMKTCPFFERNIASKPFAYPVTQEQL